MWTEMDSPVGPLRIVVHGGAITAIEFSPYRPPAGRPLGERDDNDPLLRRAVEQLTAYFARDLKEFDLPLDPRGSVFQRRVWEELRKIPRGQTRTYRELAGAIGQPTAARAVARACATNPAAVVIPCHRVVGSDGGLRGYRWGVGRKKKLLDGEKVATSPTGE